MKLAYYSDDVQGPVGGGPRTYQHVLAWVIDWHAPCVNLGGHGPMTGPTQICEWMDFVDAANGQYLGSFSTQQTPTSKATT